MKGKQEKVLSNLEEELAFMVNLESVKDFQGNKVVASNDLFHFMKTQSGFDQVRIFDTTGHEVIRINAENTPIIVDSASLQDKSNRSYIHQARKLGKGEFYTSPISLNKEHGKVQTPRKPVIRMLSSIYNNDTKVGYLVINYKILSLLDNYNLKIPNGNRFDIIDERGTSLVSLLSKKQSRKVKFPKHKLQGTINDTKKRLSSFEDDQYYYTAVQMSLQGGAAKNSRVLHPSNKSNSEFTLIHATPLENFTIWKADFAWILLISYLLFSLFYWLSFYSLWSKRKQHQIAEFKLHSVFIKSLSFVGLLDPDGTLLEANETALIFGGFTREQAVGNKFWDAPWWSASEEIKNDLIAAIQKAREGEPVRYDVEVVGTNDTRIIIDFSLKPVFDDNGKVVYIIPEGRDITEKVALQQTIESNNQLYRAVQKLSNTGVWSLNLEENKLQWDEVVYAIHEIEKGAEMNVEDGINFYREDFREMVRSSVDNAIKKNESWDFEAILVTAKNREIWVRALGYPVFVDGQLKELRGTFADIDAEKRQQEQLAEKERRLRLALDSAKLGMWDWDLVNDVLTWDDSLYTMYGIKKSDFSGAYEAWKNTVHPEDLDEAHNKVIESIDNRAPLHMTFRVVTASGEVRHIKADASVITDNSGKPTRMIGINKDVSKRVENETKIREWNTKLEEKVNERTAELNKIKVELEQQLRLLGKSAMVSETNLKGEIIEVNDTFCERSGYSSVELIGSSHNKLKSGIQSPELYEKLWLTISNGGTWQGELCNRNKNGEIYWVYATIQPFIDNNNAITRYVGVYFDITQLKESTRQLSETNAQLDAVNRELETFSYSVSHDLKAPLRALQGFSKNLLERYESVLDETGMRWLHFIQNNASKMDDLIGDILDYSKIGQAPIKRSEFSMKALIQEKITEIQEGYKVKPRVVVDEDIPDLFSDPTMLGVIWQNLIDNAFKYSQKTEQPEIRIWAEPKKDGVTYFIKDNGSGFDMRHAGKLFGIFQRLHAQQDYEGTGVGLANVQRIIKKHKGTITAVGAVGSGATFQFYLPFKKEKA
ncbi:MAG: PAS domain-containing protein [Fluviicola sp.]